MLFYRLPCTQGIESMNTGLNGVKIARISTVCTPHAQSTYAILNVLTGTYIPHNQHFLTKEFAATLKGLFQ